MYRNKYYCDFVMTELAFMTWPSEIVISPNITAPAPIVTLFIIVGCLFPLFRDLDPNVTP